MMPNVKYTIQWIIENFCKMQIQGVTLCTYSRVNELMF